MSLETPEGSSWTYFVTRIPSILRFSAEYCSRIAVCEGRNTAHNYVLWNVHTTLFIYKSHLNDRDPFRRVDLKQPLGGPAGTLALGYITALNFSPDSHDEYDVLVGFSSGEIKVLSLSAQIAADPQNYRPVTTLTFNREGCWSGPSRCVSALWVPGTKASQFISVHANGCVILHQKIIGNSSDTKLLAGDNSTFRPSLQLRPPGHSGFESGIAAASISPCGRFLALACRDGVLRVLAVPSGAFLVGFKSYFGGLLCCAWSPDGRLIAAGGEDDVVAVWNFEARGVVAHLEGHSSWVSAIAFDPGWENLEENDENKVEVSGGGGGNNTISTLNKSVVNDSSVSVPRGCRLLSVGQDCQGILWEIPPVNGNINTTAGRISNSDARGMMDIDGNVLSAAAAAAAAALPTIVPCLPRSEMTFLEPIAQLKMHNEPLCDCVFLQQALLVSSHDGCVKKWLRPQKQKEDDGMGVGDDDEL